MDMSGEYRIAAPREKVWAALNDPEILKQCIPGCEELEKTAENELTAKVRAKVGPVSARFAGKVALKNLNPPESYTIEGEGQGGAAGFARGGADVMLALDGGDTVLTYNAHANVGGKLAQLGARLINGTAKKMADQFFGKFAEVVGAPVVAGPAETPAEAAVEPVPPRQPEVPPTPEEVPPAPEEVPPAPEEVPPAPGEVPPPVPDEVPPVRETVPPTAAAEPAAERHMQATAAGAGEMVPPVPEAPGPAPREPGSGMSPVTWITGLVVLILVLVLIYSMT